MEATSIIAILLFILPGMFSEKISHLIDMPDRSDDSEFKEIVKGIMLSIPIVLIVGAISHYINRYENFEDYINAFNEMRYLVTFTIAVLAVSIIMGVLKGFLINYQLVVINFFRKKFDRVEIDGKSCWRQMFLDDTQAKYVEIIVDGKCYKGITKHYSLPNEEKEIILYTPEEWEYYPDIESKFNKINNLYINIEKDIVIKDYDMKEYNDYCTDLINASQA
ncbi:MAG TPA: hypothetical protein VFD57_07225 [Clostridia bacterium]|nr:hypothetical protein [Clostridia bacterium]